MTTHENGSQAAPEWAVTPKPWDEAACCGGLCEPALTIPPTIVLGDN